MEEIETVSISVPAEMMNRWQRVVDIMAQLLNVPSAIITKVDPPEIQILRSAKTPENPYRSGDKGTMAKHYCETVINNRSKLQVSHAPTDPLWKTAPEIRYGLVAYLGYPLCWPSGQIFGTICVLDKKENQFGERYEKLLQEFKELIESHLALVSLNDHLKSAMAEVKVLRGMLPICSSCKKIRDDRGYWTQIESYIRDHSEAQFSHSICPSCLKKMYPEFKTSESRNKGK